jgi:outer membrane protein
MKKTPMLIALLATGSLFLAAETKIGLINPPAILQSSVKGKLVIERLQALNKEKQQRYDAMQREIDALQKEVMNPALAADVRERKTAELTNKQTEIKRFAEDAQKDSMQLQQKEFTAMQTELLPIVEEIAKENGYALVFDVTQAGITFADPALDITPLVIKAYDAKQAKPAAPAAPAK